MLERMEKNRKIIETDIATLVYYMNGGLGYNEAWVVPTDQRKIMSKVIQTHFDNMNPNKKNQL